MATTWPSTSIGRSTTPGSRRRQSAVPSSTGHRVVPGQPSGRRSRRHPAVGHPCGGGRGCPARSLNSGRRRRWRHRLRKAAPAAKASSRTQARAVASPPCARLLPSNLASLSETPFHVARLQVGGKPSRRFQAVNPPTANDAQRDGTEQPERQGVCETTGIALDYLPEMWRRGWRTGEFSGLSGCRPEACGPIAQPYSARRRRVAEGLRGAMPEPVLPVAVLAGAVCTGHNGLRCTHTSSIFACHGDQSVSRSPRSCGPRIGKTNQPPWR